MNKDIYLPTQWHELPADLKKQFTKAKKLEWLTIAYLISVVIVMFLTMSSSQAMKAAWLEDMLSMVPATCFLVASGLFNKKPSVKYPYGYHRVFSIAYQLGAFALLAMGLYIFYDSLVSLLRAEHPTIGAITLFGREWWMGWVMLLALSWSAGPAVLIGRKKLPYAKHLHNKVLYTDANTQKADWQTASAAMLGIIGVGFGLWWADSVAALFISLSVIKDGYTRLTSSVKDLVDQIPTHVQNEQVHPLVGKTYDYFKDLVWVKDVRIRMREAGEIFFVEVFVVPTSTDNLLENMEAAYHGVKKLDWKLHEVVINPVRSLEQHAGDRAAAKALRETS
ncbi:cation transporter [Pontibacter actiniarum]|uniref:Cation efflux protein transmembrane domain-containing protein n=1 Tax=Pontibacter actiniarum TaxID=323450 RepID=A0A1X9YNT6_9BACT|nr:cation transporter [Pontibacter actiniarum]ARS34543.1 hypothetical protein CA264_03290 [Pontibacter actiniarum]